MPDIAGKIMVGAARIELATPAMSTKSLPPKGAETGRFGLGCDRNAPRTNHDSDHVSPDFRRGRLSLQFGGAA